jgi:hypothetical protein
MAKDSDRSAGAFDTRDSGGLFSGLLAEETEFDRRMLWRLGSWGAAAVGAVIVAVMANQAQLGWRRDQVAAADFARQAQQVQLLAKESQNEARRVAAAIETLNGDRDRLYTRVTVLEQGLDSVTGAIAKQNAAAPPPNPEPQASAAPQAAAPGVAPVASMPAVPGDKPRVEAATEQAGLPAQAAAAAPPPSASAAPAALPTIPLVASKSVMAPPDPAASKLVQPEKPVPPQVETAAIPDAAPPAKEPKAVLDESPAIAVRQTQFAVDLGSANSIGGLRALWRGLLKAKPELGSLRPIIMVRESNTGLGMQLRLGAGPLMDAAAAAKICAALTESNRACETTVFDGQRLAMKAQEASHQTTPQAAPSAASDAKSDTKSDAKPAPQQQQHRRSYSRRSKREEPAAQQPAPAKPETPSTLSSFFGRR